MSASVRIIVVGLETADIVRTIVLDNFDVTFEAVTFAEQVAAQSYANTGITPRELDGRAYWDEDGPEREGPWKSGQGEYPMADEAADILGQGMSEYEWGGDRD